MYPRNFSPQLSCFFRPILAVSLVFAGSAFAATPVETVDHSFMGSPDGNMPLANLVADSSGHLYGTTLEGGAANLGAVFELTLSGEGWTETILHSFQGGAGDGKWPQSNLTVDKDGNLFGTLIAGGIFEMSPPTSTGGAWSETLLVDAHGKAFLVGFGGLVVDNDGNLYGTNQYYSAIGCVNCGSIFEVVKPKTAGGSWQYRVLYQFGTAANDGAQPGHDLLLRGSDLYGTTFWSLQNGKGQQLGTVFKLERKTGVWSETILHQFNETDGYTPSGGLILDAAGNLFGVTGSPDLGAVGTVYELSPPPTAGGPWQETTLYSFTGHTDGVFPVDELWQDKTGSLYGVTHGEAEKSARQPGTVYKLKAPTTAGSPWTFVILHEFRPDLGDGRNPNGKLINVNGTLYGTTLSGGTANVGTVFSLVP